MQNAPKEMDLIEDIATKYGILLKDEEVGCCFFVYAHAFAIVEARLTCEITNKTSIKEMEHALNEIHLKFAHFKWNGKIDENDAEYSDIEDISPPLESAIALLKAMIAIFDDILPDPRRRAAKFRARNEAIRLYNENVLECRRHITEINYRVKWWRDDANISGCRHLRSAG